MSSIFLDTNHLFLVNPKGGVESVDRMEAAGFRAIFCNVLDFEPAEWQVVRDRAQVAGVACGPWARCVDGDFNYSQVELEKLVAIADEWQSPLIVNNEKELDNTGAELTSAIAATIGYRDAAISVECWPFAGVDWTPLAAYPVLPQIFPQEVEAADNPDACRAEWQRRGVPCVVDTYGTYWGQPPSTYARLSPYGLYTADNCGDDFEAWAPLGTREPCSSSPSPPTANGGEDVEQPVTDTEAREAIVSAARGSMQNYDADKPKGRVTVCKRIASLDNTDPKWNTCRDKIVKALDDAGVPD